METKFETYDRKIESSIQEMTTQIDKVDLTTFSDSTAHLHSLLNTRLANYDNRMSHLGSHLEDAIRTSFQAAFQTMVTDSLPSAFHGFMTSDPFKEAVKTLVTTEFDLIEPDSSQSSDSPSQQLAILPRESDNRNH